MLAKNHLTRALAGGLLAAGVSSAALAAPPSAEDFGARTRISSVSLSPGGTHVAAIIAVNNTTPRIAVWDTSDMTRPPKIIPGNPDLEFRSVRFLKEDRLWVGTVQNFEADGGRTHAYRSLLTDPGGTFFTTLAIPKPGAGKDYSGVSYEVQSSMRGFGGMSLVSALPADPDYVLASDAETGDLYKVNVHSSTANLSYERVYNGSDRYTAPVWGWGMKEVRARTSGEYIDGKPTQVTQIKNPTTGAWEAHFQNQVAGRGALEVLSFTEDPNVVLIAADKGGERSAVYPYSISERKFGEPLFAHGVFSATSVIRSHDPAQGDGPYKGRVLGFGYEGVTGNEIYWVDERMAAVEGELKKALGEKDAPFVWTDPVGGKQIKMMVPENFQVAIEQTSNDGRTLIVEREGPKTPPEYYIYIEGKGVTLIGRSRPQIQADALGDTRLIQYAARDGLEIPAFLTTPNAKLWGAGPYPAIVVPHGGPWARDYWGWDFSGWTQYFAARGYAVIQPQFRGSTGWGAKLWKAGDQQWGLKMSDDNDDAARWMIAQGIAKKGQIALHGYSYGGFAAFAAGVRGSIGEFRCAIAGAGVADLTRWRNFIGDTRFGRDYQGGTVAGMNPWDHAAETSIPMMIYHGDRDQRVPIREGQGMYDKLRAAGKPVEFQVMKDMGHTADLWSPDNTRDVLKGVDSFLTKSCGFPSH